MVELVKYIAQSLVEKPEAVDVRAVDAEEGVTIELRVDPDEGIGFFEADGGIWKLEAKKNIADYFLKNMGDLIDAGKVVVMQ